MECFNTSAKSYFYIKVWNSKKTNVALTLLNCFSQEIWQSDSWKPVCIDQSRFYNFSQAGELENVFFFHKNFIENPEIVPKNEDFFLYD